jgi:hypothetical protein
MKDSILVWIILGVFLILNGTTFLVKGYTPLMHIMMNLGLIVICGGIFLFNRKESKPKSLLESIKASKFFTNAVMFGGTVTDPGYIVAEAARYKENMLKTKKDVSHAITFKKKLSDDDGILVKDDPYIKDVKKSVVFFNPHMDFTPVPYKSKAEIEREVKLVVPSSKKEREPKERVIEIKQKEKIKQ